MKIFGIGLSKTGTSSLASALQILGYRVYDNLGVETYARGDLSSVDLAVVDAHDALTDTPIPSFYRELDVRYPGSRFILTVRERDSWLQSCRKQFTQKLSEKQNDAHRRLFVDLYGTDVFDEHGFARGYDRFVDGVRQHFRDRPGDLLTMDIAAGDGWESLCAFLGKSVPDVPFPKANVTQVRWMDILSLVDIARQAGAELMRHRNGDSGGLLDRTLSALRRDDRLPAARKAAHRAIAKGLQKLNSDIPVLSRESDPVSFEARRRWNHFWLVDPLDGERAFRDGGNAFSVDLALIEDGRPIYGVVYAPADDRTYCGRMGKAAFCSERGGDLKPVTRVDAAPELHSTNADPASNLPMDVGASVALAMCSALGNARRSWTVESATNALLQTAAAHAVLNGAGMRVLTSDGTTEVVYNRPDLANVSLTIQRAT